MNDMHEFERITALQRRLQSEREATKRDLDEIDRQLQAVTTTLELLRKEQPHKTIAATGASEGGLLAELRTKKTQLPALIAIARWSGGILLTRDAKRLLQQVGLMKATKNASNILYNVINRSERFDHVGAGKYRLKPIASTPSTKVGNEVAVELFPAKPPIQ